MLKKDQELETSKIENGSGVIDFASWGEFTDFLTNDFLDYGHYVFRGQGNEKWLLEPTFDRLLKEKKFSGDIDKVAFRHLSAFMKATRGRRGSNPPKIDNEDYWWALGQHHGLATPLLDWSNSPFVSSFFAFEGANESNSEKVAIYALNLPEIAGSYEDSEHLSSKRPDDIYFVSPLSDENPRLINQAGLYTRAPYLKDVQTWINERYAGIDNGHLMKFTVPTKEKNIALKALNRMNINHLSLFPDLSGASSFCNLTLGLQDYHFS